MQGHIKCPKCKKIAVPDIPEDSKATATMCRSCGTVIEKHEIEEIRNEQR